MPTAVCVLHCTFDVDSDGMFIVLLSHSMTRNFCSHNYNTVFFRLCHSLNINYNSGKLSPSGKLCLNITDLISWLSGEKKMNRMIKTLLFTGGRILCSSARNKADLNDTLSILFHGLNAVFSSTADSSFESNVWRWRSLFCFHSNLSENCWWNKIV